MLQLVLHSCKDIHKIWKKKGFLLCNDMRVLTGNFAVDLLLVNLKKVVASPARTFPFQKFIT